MERRTFLGLAGAAAAGAAIDRAARPVRAAPSATSDDPAAPLGGNPDGDLTVTAFFDYNCPYCKAASPELQRFVAGDGRIRLVYKDWPILAESSVIGARLALAAAYQGRYEAAHLALLNLSGRRSLEDRMREAVRDSGIDMTRLYTDVRARVADITALLSRNAADATVLGLNAVPTFLVGRLKVVGGFDVENFQDFALRARARRSAPATGSPASPAPPPASGR